METTKIEIIHQSKIKGTYCRYNAIHNMIKNYQFIK